MKSTNEMILDFIKINAKKEEDIEQIIDEETKLKEELLNIIVDITKKEIPLEYNKYIKKSIMNNTPKYNAFVMGLRNIMIYLQGYPLLSKDWIEDLAEWIGDRKVLEVMAGCGSLSYSLRKAGCNIKTTDNKSWNKMFFQEWCDIEELEACEAIKKYGNDTDIVVMSWPLQDSTAYDVIDLGRKMNKNMVFVVIGDEECVGNELLFECVEEIEKDFVMNLNKKFSSYYFISDCIHIFK